MNLPDARPRGGIARVTRRETTHPTDGLQIPPDRTISSFHMDYHKRTYVYRLNEVNFEMSLKLCIVKRTGNRLLFSGDRMENKEMDAAGIRSQHGWILILGN